MLQAVPFGTHTDAPATTHAPTFSISPPPSRPPLPPYVEESEIADDTHVASSLRQLAQQLLLHVGVHAPAHIFLHAGVVAWHGRAILFPGRSCTGKTTLVAELLKLGATYYSDDYALLDAAGFVHPYARDLQMRKPGSMKQTPLKVADLNGLAATAPAAIARIVFTHFVSGSHWAPEPLTPGLAVLEMLRHTLPAKQRPAEVLAVLGNVMRTARASHSARGEARMTARTLLSALEAETQTQ